MSLSETTQALNAVISFCKEDNFNVTKFSNNNISGKIKVSEQKVLFFCFPFDEGWHAKVNNSEAKLYRVNAGLTGLTLTPGESIVDITFEPRLKKKGSLVSIAGILGLAGLLLFSFKKRKAA